MGMLCDYKVQCNGYLTFLRRKVPEGSKYMSEHTSEVRGRGLGGGVHVSESESESQSESEPESASESTSASTFIFNNINYEQRDIKQKENNECGNDLKSEDEEDATIHEGV